MRFLLLCFLVLLFTGCAPPTAAIQQVLPESGHAKALREWWINEYGEGEPLTIVKVHKSGATSDFLVKNLTGDFRDCPEEGMGVPITIKCRSLGGDSEQTWLFVMQKGKVHDYYLRYKRK